MTIVLPFYSLLPLKINNKNICLSRRSVREKLNKISRYYKYDWDIYGYLNLLKIERWNVN